jgi:quinol monooxygenase YgiN
VTSISPDAAGAVLINVFTAGPAGAGALLAHLDDATVNVMSHQPGFISANLHCSKDGTRVTNYAQWRTQADFEAMLYDPEAQLHMAAARRLGAVEGTLYSVAHVERAGDGPFIVEGTSPLTLVVVFTCEPHEQNELVDYLIGIAQEHSVNDGFISCTIHRSLDGTRLAEYIQWRDQAALSAMAAKPSSQAHFARVKPRTSSAMYDVIKTF